MPGQGRFTFVPPKMQKTTASRILLGGTIGSIHTRREPLERITLSRAPNESSKATDFRRLQTGCTQLDHTRHRRIFSRHPQGGMRPIRTSHRAVRPASALFGVIQPITDPDRRTTRWLDANPTGTSVSQICQPRNARGNVEAKIQDPDDLRPFRERFPPNSRSSGCLLDPSDCG